MGLYTFKIWYKDSVQFTDQNIFLKKSRDQVDNVEQLQLLKSVPIVSFNFISCQRLCK